MIKAAKKVAAFLNRKYAGRRVHEYLITQDMWNHSSYQECMYLNVIWGDDDDVSCCEIIVPGGFIIPGWRKL